MMLHRHWGNLSPNAKRIAALGGGIFVVSVLTAAIFLFAPAQTMGMQSPSPRDTLTDADPRQLGIEALILVEHQAIQPNRVRADLSECFLLAGGLGDLASERTYLRRGDLQLLHNDGGVIEISIDGYAVGEDGKVGGVRGRMVSKQGVLLAKALPAGSIATCPASSYTSISTPFAQSSSNATTPLGGDGRSSSAPSRVGAA